MSITKSYQRINGRDIITPPKTEKSKYLLKEGDLLVARIGATYGKTLYYDRKEPAVFASYLIRLTLDESVLPKYDNPKDVISEQMIQSFKLSVNELLVCNEMSVSGLITAHRGYQTKLKDFKKAVSDHCQEMGYI